MIKYLCPILFLLNACSSSLVNEKTSEISDLSTTCIESGAWENILTEYSKDSISDIKLLSVVQEIDEKPFPTEILYFSEYPEELVAVSPDYYSIRYVYNENVSSSILNGFSNSLSNNERKRIIERVHNLLMRYQCEEGVKESKEIIEDAGYE